MYGGSFLGRKKLGRFLAPFDTKKGVFQIQPITNTEHLCQLFEKDKYDWPSKMQKMWGKLRKARECI